jgi:hypothetical protein
VFKTGADPKNFEWGQLAADQKEEKKSPEKSPKKIKVKKKKSSPAGENAGTHENAADDNKITAEVSEIACDDKENSDSNAIIARDKSDNINDATQDKAADKEIGANSLKDVTKPNESGSDNLNEVEVTEPTVSVTYLSLIESDTSENAT